MRITFSSLISSIIACFLFAHDAVSKDFDLSIKLNRYYEFIEFVFSEDYPHLYKQDFGKNVFHTLSIDVKILTGNPRIVRFSKSLSSAGNLNPIKIKNIDLESGDINIKYAKKPNNIKYDYTNEYCSIEIIKTNYKILKINVDVIKNEREQVRICSSMAVFAFYGFLNFEKTEAYLNKNSGAPWYLMQILYEDGFFGQIDPGTTKEQLLSRIENRR